jgi:uncharacterized protein YjeT (DUF2065 family)
MLYEITRITVSIGLLFLIAGGLHITPWKKLAEDIRRKPGESLLIVGFFLMLLSFVMCVVLLVQKLAQIGVHK